MTADPAAPALRFGPFVLQGPQGPLLRDGAEIKLQPKSLAVLWTLGRQAGSIVSKQALLDAVWPGVIVGEDALTFQIQTLRRALDDDSRTPTYIATVHRIGFRFAAAVRHGATAPDDKTALFVGRETDLRQLHEHYARAAAGERRIVFLTGEAGIGKTHLLDTFVARLRQETPLPRVARGHSQEVSGGSEPYLPMLEALGQLMREAADETPIRLLRRVAPSWLLQLPALLDPAEHALLKQQTAGVRKERMLREMAEALDLLSAEQPLVLVLEDLHWCDDATLELLTMLARRREPARLLILCSSRPVDAILSNHPIKALRQNLTARGLAHEVLLGHFDTVEVQQYLSARFAANAITPDITRQIFERSAGHPLFLTHIADFLTKHGISQARLHALPQSVRDLIELQLAQLPLTDQMALEVAGVVAMAGTNFSSASVAAGCGLDTVAVEQIFERLAGHGLFIESHGLAIWPDGTTCGCFRFRHVLHEQALLARLMDSRKARLHRQVAERVEAAYGSRVAEVASELAFHFEAGGLAAKALPYIVLTARRAYERVAPNEALALAEHGLDLLHALPDGSARLQVEVVLRAIIAASLQLQHAYAHPGAWTHLQRIDALLDHVQEPKLLETVLMQLWLACQFSYRLREALHYAERTKQLGQRLGNPVLECGGYTWGSSSLLMSGQPRAAEESSTHALQLAQTINARATSGPRVLEPECSALTARAGARWMLGYPDQALRAAEQAMAKAVAFGNPYTECIVRVTAPQNLFLYRREYKKIIADHESTFAFCTRYGHQEALSWAQRNRLLALCLSGQAERYLPELRQTIQAYRATGSLMNAMMESNLEAHICIELGRLDEARRVLERAFELLYATDAKSMEPDVWRYEGELRIAEGQKPAAAEDCFQKSLDIARARGARSFELRTAMSLARLWRRQKRKPAALEMLAPVYGWFTEGFDTPDLMEAKKLIAELKR